MLPARFLLRKSHTKISYAKAFPLTLACVWLPASANHWPKRVEIQAISIVLSKIRDCIFSNKVFWPAFNVSKEITNVTPIFSSASKTWRIDNAKKHN